MSEQQVLARRNSDLAEPETCITFVPQHQGWVIAASMSTNYAYSSFSFLWIQVFPSNGCIGKPVSLGRIVEYDFSLKEFALICYYRYFNLERAEVHPTGYDTLKIFGERMHSLQILRDDPQKILLYFSSQ